MLGYSQNVNQMANPAARLERLVPLLRTEPDNLPLHRECVELAMRGGEFARALDLVDARLTRHPAEAETLFARSNVLIGLKQYAAALEILNALGQIGVSPVAVLQNQATCHYLLQQFDNAFADTERLLASGEKSASNLQVAISSLHHLGRIDEAVKLADEHAAAAATNGPLAGACAIVYLDDEQVEKAAGLARVALAQNPDSIDGLMVQATIAGAELEVEAALRQFARVAELSPQNGRAWLGLGMLATLNLDFNKAKEFLARATELMPKHLGSWHALAWAHHFTQDPVGAERYFSHALELDRNFAESHGAMAAMHAMKGEREAAEREIELAERLDRSGLSSHFARSLLISKAQGAEAGQEYIRSQIALLGRRFKGRPAAIFQQLAARPPAKKPLN